MLAFVAAIGHHGQLTAPRALLLGVVEGVTEFLPISSTGHLLMVERLLGLADNAAARKAADTYAIAIQLGAIVAVLFLYRERIASIVRGMTSRDPVGRRILIALVIAFVPAAIIGVALESPIKDHLFGLGPVAAAWIVGGVFILWLARHLLRMPPGRPLDAITPRVAVAIGAAQVLALWPGTSRSLVTIAAGVLLGLSLAAAIEFSFLLGLATLGAATFFELAKNGSDLTKQYGTLNPLLGLVAAAVAAAIAIRWMVTYLQRHSLAVFGWYRIALGAVVAIAVLVR